MRMMLEEIYDLPLVAYLTISNFPVTEIKAEGQKKFFLFRKTPALSRGILAFLNGEARVDPLRFAEQLRNLRAVVLARYSDFGGGRVWHGERPQGRATGDV